MVVFLALLIHALAVSAGCVDGKERRSSPHAQDFHLSLDGGWTFLVDPGDVGLADGWAADLTAGRIPASAPSSKHRMPVPGPLEAMSATAYYDGLAWYRRSFELPASTRGLLAWLQFERVNWSCRVWLDGEEVGRHEGGYDAFEFDVTARLDGGRRHDLVVRVLDAGKVETDGVTLKTTPHAKETWYHNYGGILGSVGLSVMGGVRVRLDSLEPDPDGGRVRVALALHAAPSHRKEQVALQLRVEELPLRVVPAPPGDAALPVVAQAAITAPVAGREGRAERTLRVPAPRHWSPETPQLYRLVVLAPDGRLHDQRTFGFRSVQLDAEGLHLNGQRRLPRGVLLQPHDTGLGGLAPPADELEAEVLALREAGCDFARVHVRPAWPPLLDAADRHGLLVLQEPAIGWVEDDDGLRARLSHEVRWMVERDRHHPSIVLWGVLNELSGEAFRHGETLARELAALDGTRPVLVDSGGFFGASYLPAGGAVPLPMLDEHFYPPCPLPPDELRRLTSCAAPQGPTFASEYGYGTILDAERAAEPFLERQLRGEERDLFVAYREIARCALAEGDGWREEGWLREAEELHAAFVARQTEALRSNPALDLLCHTQWRAVSHEPSAGLLGPWGERRPAFEAFRHALRPLLAVAFPVRTSVVAGDALLVDVAVVNDRGGPVTAELRLVALGAQAQASGEAQATLPPRVFPPGVTLLPAPHGAFHAEPAGESLGLLRATFEAQLVADGELLERGEAVGVTVVPEALAAAGLRVVLPEGDPELAAFAVRQGLLTLADYDPPEGPLPVAIVRRPESLDEALGLEDRLRLWEHVWRGGAAVVLLNDLSPRDIGRLTGSVRGTRALPHVPVAVGVASAAGNFLGRFHVMLEAGGRTDDLVLEGGAGGVPRLLGADDGVLAPVSMLVGELPAGTRAASVTLGHFGQRLGAPLAAIPFGSGTIVFVGLPLLDPVGGDVDPRRDRLLAHLLALAAAEVAEPAVPRRPAAWEPFDEIERGQYDFGLERIARVAAFWDRFSAVVGGESGGARPPPSVRAALQAQHRALAALFEGRRAAARAEMLAAYSAAWNDELAAFLANDAVVLGLVHRLVERGQREDLELAYEALALWRKGLQFWGQEEHDTAQDWLGRAERLLRASGRVPASREED